MGIDAAHIINHQLTFSNAEEFIHQLKAVTGFGTFIKRIRVAKNIEEIHPPANFMGWITHLEDDEILDQKIAEDGFRSFYLNGSSKQISFEINPYCMELQSDEFYMGRWSSVKYMATYIRENGLPNKADYIHDDNLYMFKNRKNLYEYAQQFGTTEMITFCENKHQEWLDFFYDEKWSLRQFIEWAKKELVFVNFHELNQFDFPEQRPDIFNICIYDDFRDLK
ncbi:MAG: hypothetical protein R2739_02885 [Chitinophagales bacterium]|nr:hypothetical protein [Bacteroidota bacterium]